MKLQEVGTRGLVLTFNPIQDWITNIYICFAESCTYLVDTFCGPDSMHEVKSIIHERAANKPIFVVNTHFHWDHNWGNCAFPDSSIIAHELCKELTEKYWEQQIVENQQYQCGQVIKKLPDILIQDHWLDEAGNLELFYTPGHTADGISFFDRKDNILFVGDNIEYPLPYVESPDLDAYILTLKRYLSMNCSHFISSHSLATPRDLILENISYLEKLKNNVEQDFADDYSSRIHKMNLTFLKDNNA